MSKKMSKCLIIGVFSLLLSFASYAEQVAKPVKVSPGAQLSILDDLYLENETPVYGLILRNMNHRTSTEEMFFYFSFLSGERDKMKESLSDKIETAKARAKEAAGCRRGGQFRGDISTYVNTTCMENLKNQEQFIEDAEFSKFRLRDLKGVLEAGKNSGTIEFPLPDSTLYYYLVLDDGKYYVYLTTDESSAKACTTEISAYLLHNRQVEIETGRCEVKLWKQQECFDNLSEKVNISDGLEAYKFNQIDNPFF